MVSKCRDSCRTDLNIAASSPAVARVRTSVMKLDRRTCQRRQIPASFRLRRGWQARAMSLNPPSPEREKTLRELYPRLGDSQLEEAGDNLREYVALALRVFE